MSDPPIPLSPYAPSPASPSPKAANNRNFWRDIVRRVSRPNSTLPDLNPHQPPPSNSSSSHPSTAANLVEIIVPNSHKTDVQRRHTTDPVNASAFGDLPPAQVYDPAWNTNPFRGEAGRLGSQTTGPNTSLLPGAFTIKSSDLEDEDDDHSQDLNTEQSTTPTSTTPSPSSCPDHSTENIHSRDTDPPVRPRLSVVWRKPSPVAPVVKTKSAVRKTTIFESPHSLNTTIEHLTIVLVRQIKGEIVSVKPTEIRARVPIRTKDNHVVPHVVVLSIEKSSNSCRISLRRSFADSFRISTEEFDNFCSEFQKRFGELEQLTIR